MLFLKFAAALALAGGCPCNYKKYQKPDSPQNGAFLIVKGI